MKIGLLVLVGIPASGKTRLAETLINNVQNSTDAFHFIQISYDEFIPVIKQIRKCEWKLARYILSVKIEKLIESIKNRDVETCPDEFKKFLTIPMNSVMLWDSNVVLIIDDNMYFKSMRYSLFKIARRQNISFGQVYINCPLRWALFRNSLRSKHIIPPHVIKNMHGKIEPPNFKNKWEKYSIEVAPDWDLLDIKNKLIPMLSCCLEHSFSNNDNEEGELSKLQCRKSVLHQVDIGLRKVVGCRIKKCISKNSKQEYQEFIGSLNVRKTEILADIKSGNIHLPDDILKEIENDDDEKLHLIEFLHGYF